MPDVRISSGSAHAYSSFSHIDMTKKASYITLGCKLNYAETSTYERGFMKEGYESVPWSEKADLYIINTCSVTEHADRKSRNIIRKIHRIAPDATVIVTGCYAQLKRAEVESLEGVSLVFGANEKGSLVKTTLEFINGRNVIRGNADVNDAVTFAAYSSGEERTRYFLKVQDGCDNFCAYCTVPFARGRSRSISIAEAVEEAKRIAASGVREIVLTGVNTGDFGRKSGESFLDLLKALNEVEGIERYRISSIEPNLLTDEIVDWIASGTKFQPHFHIPLQTGADSQLEAMGRHYDTAFFRGRIDYIRSRMEAPGRPKVFFGIDVMVGLPGESEELFMQTKEFIESIKPAFIHVFPYSKRPGTPAASMPGQVSEEEKKSRVAVLEELCTRLHEEFVEENRGVAEKVLFESACKDGMMEGYTGNYIRVRRPYDKSLVNTIVDITL